MTENYKNDQFIDIYHNPDSQLFILRIDQLTSKKELWSNFTLFYLKTFVKYLKTHLIPSHC